MRDPDWHTTRMQTPPTTTPHLTLTEAFPLALEYGARVQSLEHPGTFGEVRPGNFSSTLLVVWTERPWYDPHLHDYIASSEWDLLELAVRALDGPEPTIELEVVVA